MSRSKKDYIEEMRFVIHGDVMIFALEKIGMAQDTLHFEDDVEVLALAHIQSSHGWLMNIANNQLKQVERALGLLPMEQWKFYYSMYDEFAEHAEMRILRKALKSLHKAIMMKNRPEFFVKSKRLLEVKHAKTS